MREFRDIHAACRRSLHSIIRNFMTQDSGLETINPARNLNIKIQAQQVRKEIKEWKK